MLRKQLISKYHLLQNQALHDRSRGYGEGSYKWAESIKGILFSYDIKTVLDYGCGEGNLEKEVFRKWLNKDRRPTRHGILWYNYDPAIEKKSIIAMESYNLVVCTDVLEHIEPKKLDNVLKHIFSLADTFVFLVIALNKANKSYPDGVNTHLIIESPEWWIGKIRTKTNWEVERQHTFRMHKDLVLEVKP